MEEKDKFLYVRVKVGFFEEDKWWEMYWIFFFGEKILFFYYDDLDGIGLDNENGGLFRNWEEFKMFVWQEVFRLIKFLLQQYIDKYFEDFVEKMN